MRQSIGGSWLIQLMILFILLFAGYIILTLDYSKSVKVKNEAISLVEKYDGLNEQSITLLNNYLTGSGYRINGECEQKDGVYGAYSLEEPELEEPQEGVKYYYCIKKYKGANTSYYYQLTLFYRFNLPVLGDISYFTVKGTTANFQAKDDIKYAKAVDGSTGGTLDDNGNNNQNVYYTVSFNVNGGTTSIPNQKVESGRRASKPNDPVRAGYTFEGWQLNGASFDFYSSINSDIVLVAKWSSNSNPLGPYIVTLDLNGGSFRNDEFTRYYDSLFNPNQNNVDFYVNGFTYSSGKFVQTYTKGATFQLPDMTKSRNFAKSKYTFDGWTLDGNDVGNSTITVNSDITLVAKWKSGYDILLVNYDGGTCPDCMPGSKTYIKNTANMSYSTLNNHINGWKKVIKKPGYSISCFATIDGKCFTAGDDWSWDSLRYLGGDFYLKVVWRRN